jgi:hypothetical protein
VSIGFPTHNQLLMTASSADMRGFFDPQIEKIVGMIRKQVADIDKLGRLTKVCSCLIAKVR